MNNHSCFPLMSWTIFPILGSCFGTVYRMIREENRGRSMLKLAIASAVMDVLMFNTLKAYGLNYWQIAVSPANSYITDFFNILILLSIFGKLFPLAYWVTTRFEQSRPVKWLLSLSSVIMSFYVIQWIIVGWLNEICVLVVPENVKLSVGQFYIVFAAVMALTLVLTKIFGKQLQKLLK